MDPDDHVCLCFHVSLRKIANFIAREEPKVPSQISDCLGAGTGCQWCVPFLKKLHAQHAEGTPMDLPVSPEEYARRRTRYRAESRRERSATGAAESNTDEGRTDEGKTAEARGMADEHRSAAVKSYRAADESPGTSDDTAGATPRASGMTDEAAARFGATPRDTDFGADGPPPA